MKSIKKYLLILAIAVSSFLSFSFVDNYFEISKNLDIFATVFRELNMYYVDETQPGELMKKGIDAMLESLDPYTNYIPESEIEDFRFMTTGEYGGIGAIIRQKDDYIVIVEPYEGSPAQKADLRAGDVIIEVNGKSIKGKNSSDVSKILKGQANSEVTLLIEREGEKNRIEKKLLRQEIKVNNVPYYGMLNDDVGFIKLTGFTETASREVKDAFVELKSKGMKKLIFDLRDNGGGLLKEAVNIVNFFVPKGSDVVSTRGKIKEWDKVHKALNSPLDLEIPLVVLINENSASASEIVAGAIQDFDRGVVIGERSFGKGLVQQTRPLSYNAQLKITVAKYYTPSGRCIQKLDYSHKDNDGKAIKIADSLITSFKTKNGRIVYDGNGINPDINTDNREFSKISEVLLTKNHIFDYATRYRLKHETIKSPREFRLSDKDFDDFVKFLEGKDYSYTTSTEKMIEDIKSTAEKEKYLNEVEAELEALNTKLKKNKQNDLYRFKEEIKEILENEIVSRYYFQKGRIENAFAYDTDIKKASEILNDNKQYTQILKGEIGNTKKQ
jgi:carboxyl-terminal processing protease